MGRFLFLYPEQRAADRLENLRYRTSFFRSGNPYPAFRADDDIFTATHDYGAARCTGLDSIACLQRLPARRGRDSASGLD